jgi:HEAT repeat protein
VHTSAQAIPEPAPEPAPAPTPSRAIHVPPVVQSGPKGKRKLSNAAKTMMAAVLALLVVFLGWVLINRSAENRRAALFNEMMVAVENNEPEVPVNTIKLDILLESVVNTGVVEQRPAIYTALLKSKATDGTDVDARIAEFATTRTMLPDVRETLIRDVLRMRKNPAIVPTLMAFARRTDDTRAAVAALQAVRFMAGDEQFDAFLEVILTSSQPEVRKAAEDTLAEIVKKSPNREELANKIITAYENSLDKEARHAMLRLLGYSGSPKALDLVKKALESDDSTDKIAAIVALGSWNDGSGFPLLMQFLGGATDASLRNKAFEAGLKFISQTAIVNDAAAAQKHWTELSTEARTRGEKLAIIRGLTNFDDDWAVKLIDGYKDSDDDQVATLAYRALDHIAERKRLKGDGN